MGSGRTFTFFVFVCGFWWDFLSVLRDGVFATAFASSPLVGPFPVVFALLSPLRAVMAVTSYDEAKTRLAECLAREVSATMSKGEV